LFIKYVIDCKMQMWRQVEDSESANTTEALTAEEESDPEVKNDEVRVSLSDACTGCLGNAVSL